MQVGAGGSQTAENTYTYTGDRLTDIGHNGFHYGFAYDPFGNLESAAAAGQELVRYERDTRNGNLLKCIYGNGDYIRCQYDSQDRLQTSYYRKSGTSQEQKLYSYIYNKQGELAYVTNHTMTGTGVTYQLFHDFLGRLMRVVNLSTGHAYEYHYDANNNLTRLRQSAEATFQTSYGYDKDNREITAGTFGHTRTTHYDRYGRVERRVWNEGEETQHKTIYRYWDNGNNCYGLVKEIMVGGRSVFYEYDGNGNITKISEGTENAEGKTSTFKYDKRNQLVRENNHLLNKTLTYSYDLGGNLVSMREYAFTTEETLGTPERTVTGTFNSTWKDQLTSWDGVSMTYDAMGNMLTKGDTTYIWTQGRKLSAVSGNGHQSQYFYDHTGMRVRKVVDGVTTDFRMAGELLMSQNRGGEVTYFSYDSNAQLLGMSCGGSRYFYLRNAQNDITGLIDEAGSRVVEYQYDSWGRLLGITGSLANTIGKRNPFRYRGYFYDDETGMYYLQSRYYDPDIRRFLNADTMMDGKAGILGKNIFIYAANDPVNKIDPTGHSWAAIDFAKKLHSWRINHISKPLLNKARKFGEKHKFTYSTGLSMNVTLGMWGIGGQTGISIDTAGNISYQGAYFGGITASAKPSATIGEYKMLTNALDVETLNDCQAYQAGGSVTVPVMAVGINKGYDFNILNEKGENTYYGVSESAGISLPVFSVEGHVYWGEGKGTKAINIYDILQKYYDQF